MRVNSKRHRKAKRRVRCEECSRRGAIRYHQNTQYCEESRNWVTLCPECMIENDEHWRGMWADFYSSRL